MSNQIDPGGNSESEDGSEIRSVYGERVVGGESPIGFGDPARGFGDPARGFGDPARGFGPGPGVGRFPQTGDAARWVLRRYLLTRAIGASVVRTVHWFGVALLLIAVAVWFAGVHWLSVLVGIGALLVLLLRAVLSGIQRRISGVDGMGTAGPRVERLVGQTRKGMRAELRRVGLPAAPWGPALIGLRLLRPVKRVETIRRLSRFDLTQVVPSSTLDELYLLLQDVPLSR